ncbi:MAG: MFS transporter [Chloroflexi bacterium]|nr:MFS transporter [Chloroflexota bacterium]
MSSRVNIAYGWIIVIAAFLITFITCGVNYSYGVFFLPLVNEFGWSRGLAAGVVLVAGITYAVTLPITGMLADRYGYKWVLTVSTGFLCIGLLLSSQIQSLWQLYIFDGLFIGLSISASFAIPVSLVALWFTRRQGLAVGVATLGISLGTAVIPLLITYLISALGWRTTFLLAGIAVGAICIPLALLMRRPTIAETQNLSANSHGQDSLSIGPSPDDSADTGLSVSEALHTPQFWMLFLVFLFFLLSLGLVMLHIIPYAIDSGMTPVQAATLLTLIGIFGIGGRLASGLVSDKLGIKPVIVFCLLMLACITTWIAFHKDEWTFYLFACIYGFIYSGFVTMMVRITRQVFGAKALGSIFGALMVSDGIGFGVGPWLAGLVFDITGTYQASFISVTVGLIAASILTLIIKPAQMTGRLHT